MELMGGINPIFFLQIYHLTVLNSASYRVVYTSWNVILCKSSPLSSKTIIPASPPLFLVSIPSAFTIASTSHILTYSLPSSSSFPLISQTTKTIQILHTRAIHRSRPLQTKTHKGRRPQGVQALLVWGVVGGGGEA